MSLKKYQLENYRRFLLNRMTCTTHIIEYIENCLATEDEAANYSFHKVIVHNWTESIEHACDAFSNYYGSALVPVNGINQGDLTTFYTNSLQLVLKIIKFDFIFPFSRNMFNLDILFNDKSSLELFGNNLTIEDIVSSVVSNRFTEKFELNLADFCNEKEFIEKKINFYKVSLLAQFKILMLRIGKDTKLLNLSNNNLSQPPLDILNFFIKGDLIAINLSNNNISSISELLRVSSKTERLWVEGNPLCEEMDVSSYVKNIMLKFPRLSELDGVKIKQYGIMFPFHKNFLEPHDRRTKMLVEKFLTLYFTHYDATCGDRRTIQMFYDVNASLTISTNLYAGTEKSSLPHIAQHTRNMMNPINKSFYKKKYGSRVAIVAALCQFPNTVHDPTTFTVDVLMHDKKCLVLVLDGIYKEISLKGNTEKLFQFRRTFVFTVSVMDSNSLYHITNEMFSISAPSNEQSQISFKYPTRNINSLTLVDPDENDVEAITKLFSHITNLKTSESLLRLKAKNWNIRNALLNFMKDLKANIIPRDKFIEDDDFSDTSSLMDDID